MGLMRGAFLFSKKKEKMKKNPMNNNNNKNFGKRRGDEIRARSFPLSFLKAARFIREYLVFPLIP